MENYIPVSNLFRGLYLLDKSEIWRFLYTTHKNIKLAVTKTGAPKEYPFGKTSYVETEGKDYADCLLKAKMNVILMKFNY